MIEYGIETLDEVLAEIKPLLHLHHHEVDMYQERLTLDPNYDNYYDSEDAGHLRIFTMRDMDAGEMLVGYNIFFVIHHPHYRNNLYALNDLVYIDPEYRRTAESVVFFKQCEEWLREEDVEVITYHMKAKHTFRTLMDELEMTHAEHMYTKYIGN